MNIRTSPAGVAHIKKSEELRLKAYLDSGGVPTIGWGHIAGVHLGMAETEAQAQQQLESDIASAEAIITRNVPQRILDKLPQGAWDALVDFVFNLGQQALNNPGTHAPTGVLRDLLAERFDDMPAQFRRWIYDNHRIMGGLVTRREEEALMWIHAGWRKS